MHKFNSIEETDNEFKIPPRTSLFWGAISQWCSMGVSIILGLIVTPIIIHKLGKESYGLWGLVASFVGFYGLFDFGLRSATSRFLGNAIGAKNLQQFNKVASTGKCLLWAVSILIIICSLIIIEPLKNLLLIPEQYAVQFRLLVILSAARMSVTIVMSIYGGALRASEDFILLSCFQITSVISRSLIGVIVVLMGKGVVGLAIVNVVIGGFYELIIFLRCRIRFPQLRATLSGFDKATARTLAGFGSATFIVTIAAIVRSKLDIMLVTRFGGLSQAGLYAVALSAFRYSSTSILTVAGITWPRLNKLQGTGNQRELKAFFRRVSHITAACTSLLTGLLIGLAPLLFRLWVGREYEESVIVFQILIGGFFLDFATNPGIGSLYATAHHRYFAAQTTVEAIFSFTLAFILGSKFGMKGVALGIAIPIIIIKLTIQPWYVTRNLSIGLKPYWFRVIGMASLTTIVLALGLLPVEYTMAQYGWWTLPLIMTVVLCIAGTILWLLVLDKIDRIYIVSRIKQASNKMAYLRGRICFFHNKNLKNKDAN